MVAPINICFIGDGVNTAVDNRPREGEFDIAASEPLET